MPLYEFKDIKLSKSKDHLTNHFGNKPFISVSIPSTMKQSMLNLSKSNNFNQHNDLSNGINIYSSTHTGAHQESSRSQVTANKNLDIRNYCIQR